MATYHGGCDGGAPVLGSCRNCGHDAYLMDFERGTATCAECGCVDPEPLSVGGSGYSRVHDKEGNRLGFVRGYESVRYGAYVESVGEFIATERRRRAPGSSPPYRRETYFAERISQWRMREPAIPAEDWREIVAAFEHFTDKWGVLGRVEFVGAKWERDILGGPSASGRVHSSLRCNYVIGKDDCRRLLWHIDSQLDALGRKPYFVVSYSCAFSRHRGSNPHTHSPSRTQWRRRRLKSPRSHTRCAGLMQVGE